MLPWENVPVSPVFSHLDKGTPERGTLLSSTKEQNRQTGQDKYSHPRIILYVSYSTVWVTSCLRCRKNSAFACLVPIEIRVHTQGGLPYWSKTLELGRYLTTGPGNCGLLVNRCAFQYAFDSLGVPSMSSMAAPNGTPSMSSAETPSRGSQPMGQPSRSSTEARSKGIPSIGVPSIGAPSRSEESSYEKTQEWTHVWITVILKYFVKWRAVQFVEMPLVSIMKRQIFSSPSLSLSAPPLVWWSPERCFEGGLGKAPGIWPSLPML